MLSVQIGPLQKINLEHFIPKSSHVLSIKLNGLTSQTRRRGFINVYDVNEERERARDAVRGRENKVVVFFSQSKPMSGNTTVLYASVLNPICQAWQDGKLWFKTLSSAICVNQTYLTSGISE